MPDTRSLSDKSPLAALRQFAKTVIRNDEEQCDLCGERIDPDHRHLLNISSREIICACRACVILMDYPSAGVVRKLVPTRCLYLTDFEMTDAQWDSFQIPVDVVFFCYNSAAERMTARYPSPLGPTELLLELNTWAELENTNPVLKEMEPDVEALLVNRGSDAAEYFLVPIDVCYRLAGIIRTYWRGFSGGTELRRQITQFFTELKERAKPVGSKDAGTRL